MAGGVFERGIALALKAKTMPQHGSMEPAVASTQPIQLNPLTGAARDTVGLYERFIGAELRCRIGSSPKPLKVAATQSLPCQLTPAFSLPSAALRVLFALSRSCYPVNQAGYEEDANR